ncbi:MAG: STAS domain-containing protein [Puniceicoccales bacterium]|jgi:SulP family sulfate permease|nr:STAS domain-containing protein [Puniceicoccales bacterium]
MFIIRQAKCEGLLGLKAIRENIIPGCIVGVVALPLAMAFAIASGVHPENGLYTAIVAGLCVSIFGGSRVQIAGPTGAFIVILASITQRYGIEGLQIATLMAGIILILMGLIHFGSIIKYIPEPVIVGFTSGIGVVIWVGQWKDFFGLDVHFYDLHFHNKLIAIIQSFPTLDMATTYMALLSLGILIISKKYLQRLPGALVALITATIIQWIFNFDSIATIGSAFGGIPQKFPAFHLPMCTFPRLLELVGPAFTIALLGAIESLLSAVVADGMTGNRHASNQELIGQGIANILTPLWGGFAATGAIARTATNIRSGGYSPVAGIVHSITLILLIVFLAPLANKIPLATLSAILFVVAYNMSDIPRFSHLLLRAPKSDSTVLLITFLLTVFGDLVIAVNVGALLATLFFMRRMAKSVQIELNNEQILKHENIAGEIPDGIIVYSIEGPFFFGVIETFQNALTKVNDKVHTVVLRLKRVSFIDATGLDSLHTVTCSLQKKSVKIIFCEANACVYARMRKARLQDSSLMDNFDRTLLEALQGIH